MEMQQLVPPHDVSLHHARLLKLYLEAERDVAEDLIEQVAFGDSGFHVEALEEIRDNAGRFEVKVKWLGQDEAEASWEPATALYEDIPVIFRRWTKSNPKLKFMSAMLAGVEKATGHPLQEGGVPVGIAHAKCVALAEVRASAECLRCRLRYQAQVQHFIGWLLGSSQ
ncbi:hypothetical protein DYB32_009629 [Aphanomyces invadans]|uniref:Chromo domain-containing protein n=1 Tax=Aphanomyces invadans TaxID=157072 RepID=A0A3R6YS82_9STRA|nr:hypothetical protein DYB32_009629 [Aphanomyces invadans]